MNKVQGGGMSTKERRSDLRGQLIRLAEVQIAHSGMASLRARSLAQQAGCAVGAIYNVFADMNALVLAVNGLTFARIGAEVAGAVVGHEHLPPEQRLILLGKAYLNFADHNHHLWRALFDIDLPDDDAVPDWYRRDLKALFGHIAVPVSQIFQELDQPELELMVRALFSSIHGIVILGLQNRISGVPRDRVELMIEKLLLRIARHP
jgi:AcrR family transcriptional regulator